MKFLVLIVGEGVVASSLEKVLADPQSCGFLDGNRKRFFTMRGTINELPGS